MMTITCSRESRNPCRYGTKPLAGFPRSQEHGWRERFRHLSVPVAIVMALAACDSAAPPRQDVSRAEAALPTVPLVVATAAGERHFVVEVARSDAEQQRGLMHRGRLEAGEGMLFPFAYPRIASFWMKDTSLALDLLFVRPDGTIAAVLSGRPGDLTPLSAGEPVSAVVEIAGGTAAALGIAPGDRVRWTGQPGAVADISSGG